MPPGTQAVQPGPHESQGRKGGTEAPKPWARATERKPIAFWHQAVMKVLSVRCVLGSWRSCPIQGRSKLNGQ